MGYDRNFEIAQNPSARLKDPASGRVMEVSADLPGIRFYSGNYLDKIGKRGVRYTRRSAVCLETQFFPDAENKSQWAQPLCEGRGALAQRNGVPFFL